MKVLIDTDVVLDLLLDREPFSTAAAELFARVELGGLAGYVCATSVTTVCYLAEKARGQAAAREAISRLMALAEIAPVSRAVLDAALTFGMKDFEDAVVSAAAQGVGADFVVTRNLRDFAAAPLPAYEPAGLLSMLDTLEHP